MNIVWDNVHRWEILQPAVHRVPLPASILRAMVSIAVQLNWPRFAGAICITYFGITRPGEVLRATRKDLVLAEDLLLPPSSTAYLRIENAKSRRRGKHRVQHASVVNGDVTSFLSRVFGGLSYDELLYPISGSSFRRRWDRKDKRLTPGSLRGGGALEEYRAGTDLQRILWRSYARTLCSRSCRRIFCGRTFPWSSKKNPPVFWTFSTYAHWLSAFALDPLCGKLRWHQPVLAPRSLRSSQAFSYRRMWWFC